MTGLVIHAPPGALRQWSAGDYTWLATQDALWRLGEQDGLWPLPHVTELATRGPDALALSWGRRQRVGAATSGALLRHGLDSTAEWRDGWVLDGAVMPAGARWAPDLAPLVRGHGATWSTFGQRFRLRDGRVEAIRSHPDAWDTPLTCDPDEEVATTASGSRLWGPGRCVWDLDTGVATATAREKHRGEEKGTDDGREDPVHLLIAPRQARRSQALDLALRQGIP